MNLRFVSVAALCAGLFASPLAMAQDDPHDLALWDLAQQKNVPAAYEIYLQAYPNGKFATLARLRLHPVQPVQPTPVAQPGPAPQPAPEPDANAPQFTVTPAVAGVGQRFSVSCGTLPSGGRNDTIIAVPAGSPATASYHAGYGVDMGSVAYCFGGGNGDGTLTMGPLPPGRWEFRWITTLYNLDGRPEPKATVSVIVR